MKILIVTPSFLPAHVYGGPTVSVSQLAKNIAKNNEVLVLTTLANGKDELNITPNNIVKNESVNIIYFKRQTKDHSHFSLDLFKFLYKNINNYDVIHINSWWNLVAIFSALICKFNHKKFILSPRGMLSNYTLKKSIYKRIFHEIFGKYILCGSTIHLTSKLELENVQLILKDTNNIIIPNFVDFFNESNLDNSLKINNSEKPLNFVFISRINEVKALDKLLHALGEIEFDFNLKIIGDGDSNYIDYLKSVAINNNINDKIEWLGPIYDDSKFKFMSSADLLILPSISENFANIVLESLSVGTPVLISSNIGLAEFVHEFDLGWIFNGSINDLALKLNEVNNNRYKIHEISTISRAVINTTFDNEKLYQQYLDMYYTSINAH